MPSITAPKIIGSNRMGVTAPPRSRGRSPMRRTADASDRFL